MLNISAKEGRHMTGQIMSQEEVLETFKDAQAYLEGHFILSSGLRSPAYLQCARVMMDAGRGARLCAALASKIKHSFEGEFDMIVSPAMGGVVVGYEMGRQMGLPTCFMERVEGEFVLRRGFDIPEGARILMMEDVVTTGLSSRECIKAIGVHGGKTTAAASLVDRSNGTADVGVPLFSLLKLDVPSYKENELPEELAAIPAIKPGSRGLKT